MSSTLICVTQNLVFIYLFKHSDASAGLRLCFFANAHNISNGFLHMFYSVGQDESAHMQSLAIASTAGLYKMINFIH